MGFGAAAGVDAERGGAGVQHGVQALCMSLTGVPAPGAGCVRRARERARMCKERARTAQVTRAWGAQYRKERAV